LEAVSGTDGALAKGTRPSDTVEPMAQPGEWTAARVGALLSGASPTLLRRMSAGLAVMDEEERPGCCVLVSDDPRVERLSDLPRERRLRFLGDLDRLLEAVQNVSARRGLGLGWVESEIHGRPGGVLHADVRPKYEREGQGPHLPRGQLVEELEVLCAASGAEYPTTHVYRPDPRRRTTLRP
jgi:hypothetical protein